MRMIAKKDNCLQQIEKKVFIVVPDDNTARTVHEIMQYGGRSFVYPARDAICCLATSVVVRQPFGLGNGSLDLD